MARMLPMLAVASPPFDDPNYLFEVKWDGVRAMSEVGHDTWRLWGRQGQDYSSRYPELKALRELPAGTILDGELVVVSEGRADFPALLSRHHRQPGRAYLRTEAILYVVFDLLAYQGRSLLRLPFEARRQLLHEILPAHPLWTTCQAVKGSGCAFFAQVVAQGQEGLVAKRLDSFYVPGQRSSCWKKVKPVEELLGVVIGYQARPEGIKAFLIAAEQQGELRYLGKVECGVPTDPELPRKMQSLKRNTPLVRCSEQGSWVEPAWICKIRIHGWRPTGSWRDPVFAGWVQKPDPAGAR